MSETSKNNKEIATEFFNSLSSGTEDYLDFTQMIRLFGLLEIMQLEEQELKKKS